MAYTAPYIDETGLHLPSYTDVRDALLDDARSIFGGDLYLEPDSQDYQWISAVAEKLYDAQAAMQAAYEGRSPSTASGAALASLVKLNGIRVKRPAYSVAEVLITGRAGAVISKGVVGDEAGRKWSLPENVTIPESGQMIARATCRTPGRVLADAGEIRRILTPTQGWITADNPRPAVPGSPAETDAELRARQSYSVARPSRTVMDGLRAGLAELPGVTRFKVYENDTHEFDSRGLPPHSVAAIVEGGEEEAVARTIFTRKTPGGGTVGDIAAELPGEYGQILPIRFSRPSPVDIDVEITLRPLTGYTDAVRARVTELVADHLNGYEIGADAVCSSIWGAAVSAGASPRNPAFAIDSVLIGRAGGPLSGGDVSLAYGEVARCSTVTIIGG